MAKITAGIDGMACGMCEAHINEAVGNAFQVKKYQIRIQRNRQSSLRSRISRNGN